MSSASGARRRGRRVRGGEGFDELGADDALGFHEFVLVGAGVEVAAFEGGFAFGVLSR